MVFVAEVVTAPVVGSYAVAEAASVVTMPPALIEYSVIAFDLRSGQGTCSPRACGHSGWW